MRGKHLRVILFLAAAAIAAVIGSSVFTAAEDELIYTVYLNTAPAFEDGDKKAGSVVILSAGVEYDSGRLELISDIGGDFKAAFPKLRESKTVVNSEKAGELYFNSMSVSGYEFSTDSDILTSLRFRRKGSAGGRPFIRVNILELAVEKADGSFEYLVLNNEFLRGGIRFRTVRAPEQISGYILGDADGDGEVTSADSACAQRSTAKAPVADINPIAADVDGDGEVTVADSLYILRYTVKLPTAYGIGRTVI